MRRIQSDICSQRASSGESMPIKEQRFVSHQRGLSTSAPRLTMSLDRMTTEMSGMHNPAPPPPPCPPAHAIPPTSSAVLDDQLLDPKTLGLQTGAFETGYEVFMYNGAVVRCGSFCMTSRRLPAGRLHRPLSRCTELMIGQYAGPIESMAALLCVCVIHRLCAPTFAPLQVQRQLGNGLPRGLREG